MVAELHWQRPSSGPGSSNLRRQIGQGNCCKKILLQISQQFGRVPLTGTGKPYSHNSAKTTTSKRPVTTGHFSDSAPSPVAAAEGDENRKTRLTLAEAPPTIRQGTAHRNRESQQSQFDQDFDIK
jgi:hypothetical protein